MALTEDEAAQKGQDLAEAVGVVIEVVRLPNEDRVLIAKHFIDDLIGTDETAVIESLPFLTPESTELVTDIVVPLIADALIKKLTAPVVP